MLDLQGTFPPLKHETCRLGEGRESMSMYVYVCTVAVQSERERERNEKTARRKSHSIDGVCKKWRENGWIDEPSRVGEEERREREGRQSHRITKRDEEIFSFATQGQACLVPLDRR